MLTRHRQSGLLSAAIAAFLAQSYISSLPASDATPIYLSAIYALQANLSLSDVLFDSPLQEYIDSQPSVPLTTYGFWFCGLGTSLASAVLAMLLQSWVRRYVVLTHPGQSPRGRALIRAYVVLDESLKSLYLIMDFLHLLLDISIFTFLGGLALLISTSGDGSDYVLVTLMTMPLAFSYLKVSATSVFRPTIYTTPLSRVMYHGKQIFHLFFRHYVFPLKSPLRHKSNAFFGFDWVTLGRVDQVAKNLIETQSSRSLLDGEIVAWLLCSLHNDQDIERFLECIPGFYDSDQVKQPEQVFRPFHKDRIPRSVLSLMRRTLSSATLPEDIRQRRIALSLEVIELDPYLSERTFFHALSLSAKPTIFQRVDFILLADRFTDNTNWDRDAQLLAKCVTAVANSHLTTQEPDDGRWLPIIKRWLALAIIDTTPEGQLASMRLVNLVRLVEALDSASPEYGNMMPCQTFFAAGNFLTDYATSQHQNEFCILWNRLLDSVRPDSDGSNGSLILPNIHSVYNTLHGGTIDSGLDPANYPRCTTPTHHSNPHSTPGINPTVSHAPGQAATLTTPQLLSPSTSRSTSP